MKQHDGAATPLQTGRTDGAADDTPAIVSWHAHVYYDPATTRTVAERLRERIAQRFVVQLGRWHDVPVGPHAQAMYQVAFDVALFATLVPWLALRRSGLSVLVHPNTLQPRADHQDHALWLGPALPVHAGRLAERVSADQEDAVVPNTPGTVSPPAAA